MKLRLVGPLVVLLLSCLARPVSADPVQLSGGSEVRIDYEGDWFIFNGPGFDARTGFQTWGFEVPRDDSQFCAVCDPGDRLDFGFTTPGEVDLWTGTATVDGTTYANVSFRGSLSFDMVAITFPDINSAYYFPDLPFTFTGFLRGSVGGNDVFARSLTGQGFAGLTFYRREDGRYQDEYGNRTFVFTDAQVPAPTPEPATLLLIGTGLAGVIARRHRRRGTRS